MLRTSHGRDQRSNLEYVGQLPGRVSEEFYLDRSYFSGIMGPLGSGKTHTAIFKLLQLAAEQEPNPQGIRPSRLLVIRNTYPDLTSSVIRDFAALTREIAPIRMTAPPTQFLVWEMDDGTRVECDVLFIALDRADHVRKLRGLQSTMIFLEEARELQKAVLDMATRSLGRYPSLALGGVRCTKESLIATMNAPDEDDWAAEMVRHPAPDYRWFIQPPGVIETAPNVWKTNPDAENLANLPDNYYEKLAQHKRRDWILVNLSNQFGSSIDGKAIYPEFSASLHVAEFETDEKLPVFLGMDFGLTPALVMAQVCGTQLKIFDEIVTENFSTVELCEALQQRMAYDYPQLLLGHGWGDPAGAGRSQADLRTPYMVLAEAGIRVIPAYSNSFEKRRDAVVARLLELTRDGKPSLVIHPRCRVLIKGMSGHYQYRRMRVTGDERYADVPEKNMVSHVSEALQYLCLGFSAVRQAEKAGWADWSTSINIVPFTRSPRKGIPSSLAFKRVS